MLSVAVKLGLRRRGSGADDGAPPVLQRQPRGGTAVRVHEVAVAFYPDQRPGGTPAHPNDRSGAGQVPGLLSEDRPAHRPDQSEAQNLTNRNIRLLSAVFRLQL